MTLRNLIAFAMLSSATMVSAQATKVSPPLAGYDCGMDCGFDPACWFWQGMSCPRQPNGESKFTQPLAIKHH